MEHNFDPVTGNCVDCGATRESIDDNLFPTCAKFDGPHKLALIAIYQAASIQERSAFWAELSLQRAEAEVVVYAARKRVFEGNATSLKASLDLLRSISEPSHGKTISLAEAIARGIDPTHPSYRGPLLAED